MNFKNTFFSFFLFMFVSLGSFAQYKYDIGLKASINDLENLQLEGRFHLKSSYSLLIGFTTGWRSYGNTFTSFDNNSVIGIHKEQFTASNDAVKIGVQRKLSLLATNVFYAGASISVGYEQFTNLNSTTTYMPSDSTTMSTPYVHEGWTETSATYEKNYFTGISTQLALSFGMDIPISKRFSINAELGYAATYRKTPTRQVNSIFLDPSISGGLRYSFGKRE